MTQEEKTAFTSKRYRTYSRGISLDSLEFVNNAEDEEEICLKTKIGYGSGHVYNYQINCLRHKSYTDDILLSGLL